MAEDQSFGSTRSAPSLARRSRPVQSCGPCRRRKVRCDLKSPCSACQVSRNSVTCTYQGDQQQSSPALEDRGSEDNNVQQQVPRSLSIAPNNNIDHPAKRQRKTNESELIRSVERRVQQLEHSVVPEVDPQQHSLSSSSNNHLTLLALSDRLQHVEQRLAELSQARPVPSAVTGDNSLTIPSVIPRLRHNPKKVKLFPSSHWLHTAEKFRVSHVGDSDVELTFVDTKAELADSVNEIRNLRLTMKNEQAPQMHDPVPQLLSTMPARSICDRLVNHYMRTFELIYRCFHIPTFWAEYEQYFSQPQPVVTNFAIKLGLVLAIGSVFSNDDDKVLRRSRRTWIQAAQYWMVGPSEKTTNNLDGIQIFCLLLVSRQITLVGRSPWLSESGLLRAAMAMGLHRDPQLFSLSPFQAGIRGRLWTTVLELVIHGSMDCSIPLLLSSNDFDDHMPLNVSDADLDSTSKQSPSPKPLTSYTESSIQILMRQSLPIRLEVVRAVQNERLEHSYEMAIELATKLQTVCRTLASYFRLHWSQFLSMHHAFLDMQIRRYILVLHRPFMLQAQKDPRFYFSRRVCQESAMIIATYAERLRLPADSLDDLSKLMVMSTGSFRGPLSLDVISVLGLEVVSQLEETGSGPSSASVGLDHTLVLDPLAELARGQRAPIIRLLEHINEQLLQIVKLGHPTLKRYIFLAGILSQIYAMERGQPILSTVLNTAKDSLKECYDVLQSYRAANTPREVSQDVIDNELLDGLDFGAMDSRYLDFSAFLVPTI
ncbi:transcription factor [Penicillium verrucosum]|uniref:transcription factor n=1 Tax=Penicillium verrucosum TaxID=60171 RepID=UPI0025457867|nr:transcription factor [Penicillium verrucosum]KAJ5943072.1 transcription factor [Penicillium verrucosum]